MNKFQELYESIVNKSNWQTLDYDKKHAVMSAAKATSLRSLSASDRKLALISADHYNEVFQDGFDTLMTSGKHSEMTADAYSHLSGNDRTAAELGWKMGQQAAENHWMKHESN